MNYKHFTIEERCCLREYRKALQCDMYFADPYCAWQKGTNENLNGLLREFYPKGRNLSRISPATLKNPALINSGRKKVLHFRTPQDLFQENLAKCCTWFDNSSKFTPSIKSPPFTAGYKIGFVDFRLSYRSFRDSDHGGTDILEYHLDFGGHSFYGS